MKTQRLLLAAAFAAFVGIANAQDPIYEYTGTTPWPVPGEWQAEDFNQGGEGVGCHSVGALTGTEAWYGYRVGTEVEISRWKLDTTGLGANAPQNGWGADMSYVIGYINDGEWYKYDVSAAEAGDYDLYFNMNGPSKAIAGEAKVSVGFTLKATFPINCFGVPGSANQYNFNGWAKCPTPITLPAGKSTLKIEFSKAAGNVNKFRMLKAGTIPYELSLGVKKITASGITFEKNATTLAIRSERWIKSINIYDLSGKSVLKKQVNNKDLEIQTNHIAKGIYLIAVEDESGIKTEKFNF